jgi:hypothetical protein
MAGEAPCRIEPLARHHNRAVFSCGKEVLDRYLKQQAGQDTRRRVTAFFVLVETGSTHICGYYTLSAFSIERAELLSDMAKQLPRHHAVPATLFGPASPLTVAFMARSWVHSCSWMPCNALASRRITLPPQPWWWMMRPGVFTCTSMSWLSPSARTGCFCR